MTYGLTWPPTLLSHPPANLLLLTKKNDAIIRITTLRNLTKQNFKWCCLRYGTQHPTKFSYKQTVLKIRFVSLVRIPSIPLVLQTIPFKISAAFKFLQSETSKRVFMTSSNTALQEFLISLMIINNHYHFLAMVSFWQPSFLSLQINTLVPLTGIPNDAEDLNSLGNDQRPPPIFSLLRDIPKVPFISSHLSTIFVSEYLSNIVIIMHSASSHLV